MKRTWISIIAAGAVVVASVAAPAGLWSMPTCFAGAGALALMIGFGLIGHSQRRGQDRATSMDENEL